MLSESQLQALAVVMFLALVGKFTRTESRTYYGAIILALLSPSVDVLVAWGVLSIVLKGFDLVRAVF